jgi:hypothetical protein
MSEAGNKSAGRSLNPSLGLFARASTSILRLWFRAAPVGLADSTNARQAKTVSSHQGGGQIERVLQTSGLIAGAELIVGR